MVDPNMRDMQQLTADSCLFDANLESRLLQVNVLHVHCPLRGQIAAGGESDPGAT